MIQQEFLLASGNAHKAEEFNRLFQGSCLKISPATKKIEVIEDGSHYSDNALLKAQAYYQKFKAPVMADDSGLDIKNLPQIMGIHSARFGGEDLSDNERCQKLLEVLSENQFLTQELRGAAFQCTLCFYISPTEIYYFEGKLDGFIGEELKGKEGFGYDPLFHPLKRADQSLAEIPDWKEIHSHRALACTYAKKFFNCQRNES